jgi:hypothetical protein
MDTSEPFTHASAGRFGDENTGRLTSFVYLRFLCVFVCPAVAERTEVRPGAAPQRRQSSYDTAFLSVLKARDAIPGRCGVKGLIPLWMPWVGRHFQLSADVERPAAASWPSTNARSIAGTEPTK